jgi:hypothetical protein
MGLLEFYNNLVGWIARAQRYYEGFMSAISSAWERRRGEMDEAVQALSDAFHMLRLALVDVGIQLGLLSPAARTSMESARVGGLAFGNVMAGFVSDGIRMVVKLLKGVAWVVREVIVPAVRFAGGVFAQVMEFWKEHTEAIKLVLASVLVVLGLIAVAVIAITVAVGVLAALVGAALLVAVMAVVTPFLAIYRLATLIKDTISGWFGNGRTEREAEQAIQPWMRLSLPNADLTTLEERDRRTREANPSMTPIEAMTTGSHGRVGYRKADRGKEADLAKQQFTTVVRGEMGALQTEQSRTNDLLQQFLGEARRGAFRTTLADSAVADAARRGESQQGERQGAVNWGNR